MRNNYENWLKANAPAGRTWGGRLLALSAAGTATAAVGLSVVLIAGLGRASGELEAAAPAPATTSTNVRYAAALPTVTVVGRREDTTAPVAPAETAALPARSALVNATVGMSGSGDNIRQ